MEAVHALRTHWKRALGITVGLLIVAAIVAIARGWIHVTPLGVRSLGGILQILGIGELAYELRKVSKRLYPDRQLAIARAWEASRRGVRTLAVHLHLVQPKRVDVIIGAAVVPAGALIASPTIQIGEEGMTVEQRLDQHQAQIKALRAKDDQLNTAITEEKAEREQQSVATSRKTDEGIHDVKQLVSDLLGEGLHLQWFAGIALLAGVVCTTWPAGIAHLFRS